jgi:hypothetical protein
MYSIRDWEQIYEKNRTRELKDLSWIALPISQGPGYARMLANPDATPNPDGPALFGCFVAIVQLAATCSPRGTLASKSGRPWVAAEIAVQIRMSVDLTEKTLRFCSQTLDWIIDSCNGQVVEGAGIPQHAATFRTAFRGERGVGERERMSMSLSPCNCNCSSLNNLSSLEGGPGGKILRNGQKVPGNRYLDFVWLTADEYDRLATDFGATWRDAAIRFLNESAPNLQRFASWTDHNRILRGWVRDKLTAKGIRPEKPSKPQIAPRPEDLPTPEERKEFIRSISETLTGKRGAS